MSVASPFSNDIVELLKNDGALSVHIMQVLSIATQSFPTSPFQFESLLEQQQQHDEHQDDNNNNNDKDALPPPSPLTGPSGVSVTVRFLKQQQQQVQHVDVDVNGTYSERELELDQSFLDLLRELVAKRFILAPLSTIDKRRLHRHRYSNTDTGSNIDTISTSTSHASVNKDTQRLGVVEMTTILPMEGSPFAAEGVKAFMEGPSSSASPCGKDFGIFSVADATAWSNLLLGVPADGVVGSTPPQPLASRSRGLWMTLQSSPSCHASTSTESSIHTGTDDDNDTDACTFQVSRGLHYSVNVPVGGVPTPARTKPFQNKAKRANAIVPLTLSLADLLPGNNKDKHLLRTCPLADATTIDTVLIEDAHASASPNSGIKFQPGCRSIDDDLSKISNGNGNGNDIGRRHVHSLSLLDSGTDISLPCLTMTMRDDNRVKLESSTTTPFWHVGLHVLRPNGVANSGTLRSTIRNEHTFCGAQISFVQTIPAVLIPRWQSLEVQSSTAGRLSWTDLANTSIAWKSDDSVDMQFRYELPPASSLFVSLDYNPAFLSFDSIPGDANRGVELPPIRVHFVSACNNMDTVGTRAGTGAGSAQLYSQSVLLLTPLPDMSMPFNVLSLSCTLFAFIIGSLINVLVRRGTEHVKYQLDPSKKPKSKLDKLKDKARRVKERLWKKARIEPAKS
jgi:hypothetical protein